MAELEEGKEEHDFQCIEKAIWLCCSLPHSVTTQQIQTWLTSNQEEIDERKRENRVVLRALRQEGGGGGGGGREREREREREISLFI